MIVESSYTEKAQAAGDWRSGLLDTTQLDGSSSDAIVDQVELLQKQSGYCGKKGMANGQWCASDTFQLLNYVFLFFYVADVIFKVSVNSRILVIHCFLFSRKLKTQTLD